MSKSQKYYRKHRNEILKQKRGYYGKNKARILKKDKIRRKKNKKRDTIRRKKCYIENRKKILRRVKKWQKKNKKAIAKRKRKRYLKMRALLLKKQKAYYQKHKKRIKKYRKRYDKLHKKDIRRKKLKYVLNLLHTNPQYKLAAVLRDRLRIAVKKGYKSGSAVRDLGCTIEFLKSYLEKQFYGKMSWSNYGTYWQIDHIEALCLFDLTDRKQLLKAVHYTNLQPLTIPDHRKKTLADQHKFNKNKVK